MRSVQEDLTAKARIRDAAILRFATDGLDAPLRTIAADAGVSAGLIVHHFGSRAGLMQACDDHVVEITRSAESDALDPDTNKTSLMAQLGDIETYAPMFGYVLRCLQAGGAVTDRIVELFIAETLEYLEASVAAGIISPSRDPQARARLLVELTLGSLLLELPARKEKLDIDDLPLWIRSYTDRVMLPYLELFTEPLLTDSSLLDAYLAATAQDREPP